MVIQHPAKVSVGENRLIGSSPILSAKPQREIMELSLIRMRKALKTIMYIMVLEKY